MNRRFVADDHIPLPHFPSFHQAIHDVGILAGEVFDLALVCDVEN
jgi:hypothetical protein